MFTVLCVDSDERHLTFLKQLFSTQTEFHILGEAHNSGEAVAQAIRLKPNIVLMDLAMLQQTDFAALRSIKNLRSQTQIVIMTRKSQIPYQTTALDNGADAFVGKAHLDTDLFLVMRSIAAPSRHIT